MGKKDKNGKNQSEDKGPLSKALARINQLEDELCELGSSNEKLEAENAELKKDNEGLKGKAYRFGTLAAFLAVVDIILTVLLVIIK